MTNPLQITVSASGERLDKHLAEALPTYSRAQLQQWIKDGQVRINDNKAGLKAGTKPHAGDVIIVDFPVEEDFRPKPEDIPLTVLYEDDDLAVIEKPAGLVVPVRTNVQHARVARVHDDVVDEESRLAEVVEKLPVLTAIG